MRHSRHYLAGRQRLARRALALPAEQMSLELVTAAGGGEDMLREAFRRLEIAQQLSFEQAMSDRIWSICVRNFAVATVRRTAKTIIGPIRAAAEGRA